MATSIQAPSQEERPLISILIATYNCSEHLPWALRSLKEQSFRDFEVLVADGGSTDGTVEVIEQFADLITYSVSEPDAGITNAWNKLLGRARGRWIYFLGADDKLLGPDVLEKASKTLLSTDTRSFVFGSVEYFDETSHHTYKVGEPWQVVSKQFLRTSCIPHQGTFHAREAFDKLGLFDERYKIVADYEFLLRSLSLGEPDYIPGLTLARFSVGGASTNISSRGKTLREIRKVQMHHGLPSFHRTYLSQIGKLFLRQLAIRFIGADFEAYLTSRRRMKNSPVARVIHAPNCRGKGTSAILQRVCKAADKIGGTETLFLLPPGDWDVGINRKLSIPHSSFSRVWECLLGCRDVPKDAELYVLGDIPLPHRGHQTVFVQQPHLIKPEVNPHVGMGLKFRLLRYFFARNLPFADRIIVQTEHMKQSLLASYPRLQEVEVIGHPTPNQEIVESMVPQEKHQGCDLFLPTSSYPHKNNGALNYLDGCGVRLFVTLAPQNADQKRDWVHWLGALDTKKCLQTMSECHGLFFPSLLESYGLPLAEALAMGRFIICPDLPYAREICGDTAFYFDPDNPSTIRNAVARVQESIKQSSWPAPRKYPSTGWSDFLSRMFREDKSQ